MSHKYFGRAVPVNLRTFPAFNGQNVFSSTNKTLNIPADLKGRVNILIIGFKKKHFIQEMVPWYEYAFKLRDRMNEKHEDQNTLHVYTLLYRNIFASIFHRWLCWRYKNLVPFYLSYLPESRVREITDHVYIDYGNMSYWKKNTSLPDTQRAYILLIDREGKINWCEDEEPNQIVKTELEDLLLLREETLEEIEGREVEKIEEHKD